MLHVPPLGYGVGLRPAHYPTILAGLQAGTESDAAPGASPVVEADAEQSLSKVDWFEVISENFFAPGGNPRRMLRAVRERFPVVMHGVALSLGSVDALDEGYLDRLATLAGEVEPAIVSDHLCWGGVGGHFAHDLLPLPFTEEALGHVTDRVLRVQDRLKRRILVENVSSYVAFAASSLNEWEFLTALAERADCGLLLDVNNVFVSAHNHGFDARAFIAALPPARIGQIHLAGHSTRGALLLDTHDHPVRDEVWELFRFAVAVHGEVPTLIEWDDRLPPFARVVAEAERARAIGAQVVAGAVSRAPAQTPAEPVTARRP
jgi:uncharacterized protein (UPF0276 family)